MSNENMREKRERKLAAGKIAIDMLIDTWSQFAVGDDKKRWAGGLSTLEVIGDFLRLQKLIDENGQLTEKAKHGEYLVLDRPDESADLIKELERELEEARDDIRKLKWYTPAEHIKIALTPMFAEFLDIQQEADNAETFAKCDGATARAHSLLNIILHIEKMSDQPEVWACLNNKSNGELGRVEYYGPWKRFIFGQADYYAIFSADCCRDMANFLEQLNEGKK